MTASNLCFCSQWHRQPTSICRRPICPLKHSKHSSNRLCCHTAPAHSCGYRPCFWNWCSKQMPIASLTTSEVEVAQMGAAAAAGHERSLSPPRKAIYKPTISRAQTSAAPEIELRLPHKQLILVVDVKKLVFPERLRLCFHVFLDDFRSSPPK